MASRKSKPTTSRSSKRESPPGKPWASIRLNQSFLKFVGHRIDSLSGLKLICYPVNHTGSNPKINPQLNTVAIIPARFASTRLPGKALLEIDGKPMICWVAQRALEAKAVSRVIVATDSRDVFDAVSDYGFEAAMTASSHVSGTDRIAEVAAKLDDAEIIVNLQGDEPLISPDTIDRAVEQMVKEIQSGSNVGIVTTWEPIKDLGELLTWSVVKVVIGDDNIALYFSRSPMPFPRDATALHGDPNVAIELDPSLMANFRKHTGLYVYRRDILLEFTKWSPTRLEQFERLEQIRALEHGVRIRVVEACSSSIGVDTEEDLERVRQLVAERKVASAL